MNIFLHANTVSTGQHDFLLERYASPLLLRKNLIPFRGAASVLLLCRKVCWF